MKAAEKLKESYIRAKEKGEEQVFMNALELAGYYLETYPADPVQVLLHDISGLQIPYSAGQAAKILIQSVSPDDRK